MGLVVARYLIYQLLVWCYNRLEEIQMLYEELRRQFEEHVQLAQKRRRLIRKADSGKLSPGELADCDQKISELTRKCSQFKAMLARLTKEDDQSLAKLNREFQASMDDRAAQGNEEPTSTLQKARSFIGTMSLLVLGTWMIDSWRRK